MKIYETQCSVFRCAQYSHRFRGQNDKTSFPLPSVEVRASLRIHNLPSCRVREIIGKKKQHCVIRFSAKEKRISSVQLKKIFGKNLLLFLAFLFFTSFYKTNTVSVLSFNSVPHTKAHHYSDSHRTLLLQGN